MQTAAVRERAAALPRAPGVYQFLADDRPIYIGKAVVIRDRVRSYADPASQRVARAPHRRRPAGGVSPLVHLLCRRPGTTRPGLPR